MSGVFRTIAHPVALGRTRNGLKLVAVATRELVFARPSYSVWNLELRCGHRIEGHYRTHPASKPPRFAGCATCTEQTA